MASSTGHGVVTPGANRGQLHKLDSLIFKDVLTTKDTLTTEDNLKTRDSLTTETWKFGCMVIVLVSILVVLSIFLVLKQLYEIEHTVQLK